MVKPTIILATSNGIGMGHLARATAIASAMQEFATPVIVSVAGGIAEIPSATGIRCEYIPGKTRGWMPRKKWDTYFRDRLVAIAQETGARVIAFDGVVPYPGFIATKLVDPRLDIVWIRRGMWQKNLLRFVLPFQSQLVDRVIEPGDFARGYDLGPTAHRSEGILTAPVSLFQKDKALSRDEAREILGLDLNRPAVLVQLGTGESDVNEKMTAALRGLIGWKDLQVVLTKDPVDRNGASLAPDGLDIRVVRHFPLAQVLRAFDASVCATGYNGVHELLPAQVPTVFVSNIRGTDDQEARAKWCHDMGFALRADQADLQNITAMVKKLQDSQIRERLHQQCAHLPDPVGGEEIAKILYDLASKTEMSYQGPINRLKRLLLWGVLRRLSLIYRAINPHKVDGSVHHENPIWGSQTTAAELIPLITGTIRFEHLITGASDNYIKRRKEIANSAYGTHSSN
jgi:UDP-N-acetylglucosamine:LPS N-acetylglucosamine transferase